MNDVTTIRTLDPVTQPISPAKFAHFVLRTGQIDTMASGIRRSSRRGLCSATKCSAFCPMTTSTIAWR